jgi:macrodomain Ter protein organizer (MatP/YcbG family)
MYIVYICALKLEKRNVMTTALTKTKRKNIDIKPDTFRTLSIRAVEQGTNLKKYIENLLDSKAKEAEEEEDLLLYSLYVKNNPACWEFLNDAEQEAFEKEMGL